MITYVKDWETGRIYGVVVEGSFLTLSDLDYPDRPLMVIRLADLFLEDRFTEVASTHDVR